MNKLFFTTTFGVITLLASTAASIAQSRYVTLTIKTDRPENMTNSFTISEFETAELVSYSGSWVRIAAIKDGVTWSPTLPDTPSASYQYFLKMVVAGPATFTIKFEQYNTFYGGMCTFEIKPESFGPDKTLIIPAGTNQVFVGLESSTNLVHWSTATNGVYGSPVEARFFRIKAQKVE